MNQLSKSYSTPPVSVNATETNFYKSFLQKKSQQQQQKTATLNSRIGSFLLNYKNRDSLIIRLKQHQNEVVQQEQSQEVSPKKGFLKRFKSYHSKCVNKKQIIQVQPVQVTNESNNKLRLHLSRESLLDTNLSIINEDLIDLDQIELPSLNNSNLNKKRYLPLNEKNILSLYKNVNNELSSFSGPRTISSNDSFLNYNTETNLSTSISTSSNNLDSKIMDVCICELMVNTRIKGKKCTCKNETDTDSAICSAEKLSIGEYSRPYMPLTQPLSNSIDNSCLSLNVMTHLMATLSVCQIEKLRKLSLEKLNALFMKYLKDTIKINDMCKLQPVNIQQNTPQTHQRFYSFRSFNTHQSVKDKRINNQTKSNGEHCIFGKNLNENVKRSGSLFMPLPKIIIKSMRLLETNCSDLIGIFRKPGVKTRIDEMHKFIDLTSGLNRSNLENTNGNLVLDYIYENDEMCHRKSSDDMDDGYCVNEISESSDISQSYDCSKLNQIDLFDLADLIKQFFRELPECLLTNYFSQIFISIYSPGFDECDRFRAMQYAITLMPDENREALFELLKFLHNIELNKETNSMNATNLSTCFAPSIFNLAIMKMSIGSSSHHNKENTLLSTMFSPKRLRKQFYVMPDQKDLEEQRIAINCFADMIVKVHELFQIPNDLADDINLRKDDCKEQILDLSIILNRDDGSFWVYVNKYYDEIVRESKERSKGWISCLFDGNIEIFNKKLNKSNEDNEIPLKLFKCTIEMDAIQFKIVQKILSENVWNKNVSEMQKIIDLDNDTDIVRYTMKSISSDLDREVLEFRSWKRDVQKCKYGFIATSIANLNFLKTNRYVNTQQINRQLRANNYYNHYFIEYLTNNKMRIVYFNRVDLKGKSLKWYNNTYSYVLLEHMKQLKNYLKQNKSNKKFEQCETNV